LRLLVFSYSTMTTTGLGDLTSANSFCSICGNLEAMTAQVYLAVVIARLVGMQAGPATPRKAKGADAEAVARPTRPGRDEGAPGRGGRGATAGSKPELPGPGSSNDRGNGLQRDASGWAVPSRTVHGEGGERVSEVPDGPGGAGRLSAAWKVGVLTAALAAVGA